MAPAVVGTRWPLSFLPLHAAGYNQEPPGLDGRRRTVMDRVISSYTPTVRGLGYARTHTTTAAGQRSATIPLLLLNVSVALGREWQRDRLRSSRLSC